MDPPAEAFGLTWPAPLPPYQQAGIARLLARPGVLLADEMGLGKTIQAIAALRLLLGRPAPGTCAAGDAGARGDDVPPGDNREAGGAALVVVPASLVLQWRRHLRDWAPDLVLATCAGPAAERRLRWRAPAQVFLVGYDSLRADATLPAPYGPLRRRWRVVVADEAQRIKNAGTDLAVTLKALDRERAWALTGTPLENRADDTASILDFVAPDAGHRDALLAGMRRALGEVQLRRRRAEVLPELPPKTAFVLAPDLGPRQRAAYDAAERDGLVWLRTLGARVQIVHVLELILRLKQICNACPESGESAKCDDLVRRVAAVAAGGEKTLVFSQFVARPFGAERLADALAPLHPVLLTGRMTPAARDRAVADFAADPRRAVMVASLRAGGVGLNLTAASVVFHFDLWWNPASAAQAEDRAHRIGQTRPVQVFAYLTPETIEQRIAMILAEKRALFADLIEGVAAESLGRLDLPTLLRAVGV